MHSPVRAEREKIASSMVHARNPEIADLAGLWRRSLISWPDGNRDTTTHVRWLQGSSAYVDLRQPAGLGDFHQRRRLTDLTLDDCVRLAQQHGFAGQLRFDGAHFEWVRVIDFQPETPHADAGSLSWDDGVLIERGRDSAYIEHWHRDASVAAQPVASIAFSEEGRGARGRLLRVGQSFMYARDRAVPLPGHQTLSACVLAAPTLSHARALVDCEISFGQVQQDGFLISASSLPYRVGDLLGQELGQDTLTTIDRDADGAANTRRWAITEREGELNALHRRPCAAK